MTALLAYAHGRRQTQGGDDGEPPTGTLPRRVPRRNPRLPGRGRRQGHFAGGHRDAGGIAGRRRGALPKAGVPHLARSVQARSGCFAHFRTGVLGAEPLWEPVQAIACRALARLGQRRALPGILPARQRTTFAFPSGRLAGCAHREEISPDWVDRIVVPASDLRPRTVRGRLPRLLQAETDLATGRNSRKSRQVCMK